MGFHKYTSVTSFMGQMPLWFALGLNLDDSSVILDQKK